MGIAGANRGLTSASLFPTVPTSNPVDGFYPGVLALSGVVGQSRFLQDINRTPHDEGQQAAADTGARVPVRGASPRASPRVRAGSW